jgi:cytochrome c peroxidase
MKIRFFSLLVFMTLAVLALENCRRDPLITHQQNPNDPDSLYQGTKYTITLPFLFPQIPGSYKDSLTVEGIQLGRRLFYDKHFSVDGQKACASCHHLQYAFCDSGNVLSTNEFGFTKRNAPTIQNLAWAPAMFWDGRQPTLAAQAQDAFQHELGFNATTAIAYLKTDSVYTRLFRKAFGRPGTITEREVYLAIQEFEMTAISANSRFDSLQRGQANYTASETNAFTLFTNEIGECFHCHAFGNNLLMANYAPGFAFQNNGLQAANNVNDFADPGRGGITGVAEDYGCFKNPTLRNVAVSGPYMHDGRYKTLQQVLNFYSDSINLSPTLNPFLLKHFDTASTGNHLPVGGLHLTAQDKADLITLLNDMTDTSFLNNPNLKSPF